MHIVQVYQSKVPVLHYGGMERVVEALAEGLLELGHKVTIIAYKGDYEIPGVNFVELDRYENLKEANEKLPGLIPGDADIVHFHLPLKFENFKFPYVCTMHGHLGDEEDRSILHDQVIFLCEAHARRYGKKKFVFNGLNPKSIPLSPIKIADRNTYAFLGRAALKRKGLHHAKKIAGLFKTKLVIGGGHGFGWFGRYQFLGQIGNREKFKMLGEAKALLFPIEWEEPFGLVMIESMLAGTPVFGLNRGSVKEVLGEQPFNLIADNIDVLINKIKVHHNQASPQEIRDYANRHFSHLKMCEKYLVYYQEAIDQSPKIS